MPTAEDTVALYLKLAERHEKAGRAQERDRFTLLAADAALAAGRQEQAERLRRNLLAQNPNHLLKPYPTLAEAMKSPDISAYIQQLRRNYPYEKAEQMLQAASVAHGPGSQASVAPGSPFKHGAEDEFALPLDADAKRGGGQVTARPEKKVMPEPTKPAKAPEGFQPLPSRPTTQAAGPVVFNMVPQEPRRDLLGSPIPPPEPEPPAGAWVGLVLFVLLLAGAIALLGYTFVLPFIALP